MKELEQFNSCAQQLKALADPIRLKVIQALFNGPCSVSTLCELLDEPIVTLSHHLGVLRNAKLVQTRRDGKFIVYSLADDLKGRKSGKLDLGCCQLDLKP